MKRLMMVALAAPLVLAACSFGRAEARDDDAAASGPTVKRDFPVGAFDRIEIAGAYDVDVRTGGDPSAHAEGPAEALDQLVVVVDGRTLKIHPRKSAGRSRDRDNLRLFVTASSLAGIDVAGSGETNVDKILGESFDAGLAGSGDLKLGQVEVRSLKASVAGSGDLRIQSGKADDARYAVAGSGDIDATGLAARDAKVSIAGSGDIAGRASGTAAVKIVGSGDVRMTGGAKCTVSKMGSGSADCS